MKKDLLFALNQLERMNHVEIIYACESGSRAWGTASFSSDFDVRFIYVHPVPYYLSIQEQDDVIHSPRHESLDFQGWDLKKTIKLFQKSNPSLYEWLYSPIVYKEKYSIIQQMRDLSMEVISLPALFHHYAQMAKRNIHHFSEQNQNKVKQLINIFRPICMCKWIMEKQELPPVQLKKLLGGLNLPKKHLEDIHSIIQMKKDDKTSILENEYQEIFIFLQDEMKGIEQYKEPPSINQKLPTERFNCLFINSLKEVWGNSI
ncbi:putative nucleotidyltransferase [Oikeobacillus pervagus]|uniref:Nucleotidyltransferase n=1 Tax=Oikeobacillus pervagus TaxID=1325931 RepID=A0AAJ1T494_9BACI|nr:nucleotidyltransferase domain-containing protein [Oikeobacillus pervagus]MDQ0216341.1 putative nucleotidyltransferase [Oikeobacillus pervagus]